MNKTETFAFKWLQDKFKGQKIVFQRRNSPDFILENGKGYEAKLLRNNSIIFTEGQLTKLMKFGDADILVMPENLPEPESIIPIAELKDAPIYWKQYRICNYLTFQKPNINYRCEQCGKSFTTPQGSRRRYCPKCLEIRVKHIKQENKEDARNGIPSDN